MNRKRSHVHAPHIKPIYLIAVVGIAVVVVLSLFTYAYMTGLLVLGGARGNGGTNGNGNTTNNYYNTNTGQPSSNQLAPTSLTVTVSPNPMTMGGYIYGAVISNGYNSPVTIYAKLTGTGEVQSFGGLLDASGKFEQGEQMNTPGFWEFWATANGVTSNVARLTVEGLKVQCESSSYSKSMRDSLLIKVYSVFSGNVGIVANDPAHSVSYPVTNCVVSSKGYGEVAPSLDFLPNGGYEMDAVNGPHKASDYTQGTFWVNVGR